MRDTYYYIVWLFSQVLYVILSQPHLLRMGAVITSLYFWEPKQFKYDQSALGSFCPSIQQALLQTLFSL